MPRAAGEQRSATGRGAAACAADACAANAEHAATALALRAVAGDPHCHARLRHARHATHAHARHATELRAARAECRASGISVQTGVMKLVQAVIQADDGATGNLRGPIGFD